MMEYSIEKLIIDTLAISMCLDICTLQFAMVLAWLSQLHQQHKLSYATEIHNPTRVKTTPPFLQCISLYCAGMGNYKEEC